MSKKLLCAVLAALLLAACAKQKKSPPPTALPAIEDGGNAQTTILFAVNDYDQMFYEGLIESFEEANPDIHVRLVSIDEVLEFDLKHRDWPDDAWQRLASRADVIDRMASHEPVRQGLIYDLTPLVQADPNFQPDDFYPGVLESSRWGGGSWFLPTQWMFDLIVYDKGAFDQAGTPHPQPGWSWDDFRATAKSLTAREGDQVARWGFVGPDAYLAFIEGRVGPLVDIDADPPTTRFDRPEVIEATRWYVDLYLEDQVMPLFESLDADSEAQTLIASGQAAMWHIWSGSWKPSEEQDERGVVPYPVDAPDSRTTLTWMYGLSMSAGTAHPDAAWRWMDFVSRQADTPSQIQSIPVRRSVAESSGFWDEVDGELAAALRYAIDHSYRPRWTTASYYAFIEALEATLAGAKSIEEALADAQTHTGIQEAQADQAEATSATTLAVISPKDEEPSGEKAVSITFFPGWGVLNPGIQAFRDLAQQFHEMHPDIQIEVQMPDFRNGSPDLQSLASSADCFQWMPEDILNPKVQAAILSLQPFLDADPSFAVDDFYPPLLEQFTWQGQLWALPAEAYPPVIEYNKDLFDAAGVDYPALDGSTNLAEAWTTDDFVELAIASTRGEGEAKQYGFVPEYIETADLLFWTLARGGRLVDVNVDPPTFTLNDPATVEAVRWYANLATEYGVKPIFLVDTLDGSDNRFENEWKALISGGRAAMWSNAAAALLDDDIRSGLNVGVAPWPVEAEGARLNGLVTAYFISAQARDRQACWQWINFLTMQPGMTPGLPARRSLAESDAYRQQVGAERAAVYQASVANTKYPDDHDFLSTGSWLDLGLVLLCRAYDQVVNGQADVTEALNAAQKMADDYRACVVVQDAFYERSEWETCLKEVSQ